MKFIKPIAVAVTLAVTSLTFVDTADARRRHQSHHHHRHHGGHFNGGSGLVFGLAAGTLLGAAIAPRYSYGSYYGGPGYYYGPRYQPAPVYYRHRGGNDWYAYCSSRYRSFNPRTGLYKGYDGRWHACR